MRKLKILISTILLACLVATSTVASAESRSMPINTKRLAGGVLAQVGETFPESYTVPYITPVKDQGSQGLICSEH